VPAVLPVRPMQPCEVAFQVREVYKGLELLPLVEEVVARRFLRLLHHLLQPPQVLWSLELHLLCVLLLHLPPQRLRVQMVCNPFALQVYLPAGRLVRSGRPLSLVGRQQVRWGGRWQRL